MGNVILPFELDVEMKTYLLPAFSLGVMKACLPDYDVWLCNKLINCNCRRRLTNYWDTSDEDLWSVNDGGCSTETFNFELETAVYTGRDIVDFNVEMLRHGYYISGHYNEFFIPGTKAYKKYCFHHRYILFGYNKNGQVFKSATYLENGFYSFIDISFSDYLQAITNDSVEQISINYYRPVPQYRAAINLDIIKRHLQNYICSTNNTFDLPSHIYGISVWESLVKYIAGRQGCLIDLRYTRAFMEHRVIMYKRFLTLEKLSYVDCKDLIHEYEKKVYYASKYLFNMSIKYNLSPQNDLLLKIADTLSLINQNDKLLLAEFISEIS